MHYKKVVKKIFKVLFILIQTLIFISSISISVISMTIYYKASLLVIILLYYLFVMQVISILGLITSMLGMNTINSRKKIKLFSFTAFTLILMNIEILLALKSSLIPEKSTEWGDNAWGRMDEYQKEFIQTKFNCCGFKEASDRPGIECMGDVGCLYILYSLSRSLRSFIEKTMVFLFLIESTGLGIISMLKLRR